MKNLSGAIRESNPRPLAPKARIMPLDQSPSCWFSRKCIYKIFKIEKDKKNIKLYRKKINGLFIILSQES